MGMESNSEPCAGFVAVDEKGTVCAGFRQCGSNHGTTGLNPKAQPQVSAPTTYQQLPVVWVCF